MYMKVKMVRILVFINFTFRAWTGVGSLPGSDAGVAIETEESAKRGLIKSSRNDQLLAYVVN
jgi:hypothetical protein